MSEAKYLTINGLINLLENEIDVIEGKVMSESGQEYTCEVSWNEKEDCWVIKLWDL